MASASAVFSKSKDDLLIKMVRLNPILYDPFHEHFRNVIIKHEAWMKISKSLDIPLIEVRKRWRHFRDHYLKKLKMRDAGLTRYKPWEHMQSLEFLAVSRLGWRPRVAWHGAAGGGGGARETLKIEVPPDGSCSPQRSDNSNDEPLQLRTEPSKKRKYSSDQSTEIQLLQSSPVPVEPRIHLPETEKSHVHKFFDSLADIVEQFPPPLIAQTRLKVCQLVTEMELQMHNEREQGLDSTLMPVKQERPSSESPCEH